MAVVTVIVPVYRAEDYIERCVNSICSQTMSDFELILVDDASPDQSGAICERLASLDERLIVIHAPKNEGAAAARNRGLDIASGEYIAFCDGDDVVSSKWLEHMLKFASEQTLAIGAYCHEKSGLGEVKPLGADSGLSLPITEYYTFSQCGIAGYLCNALYNNRIIQQNYLRLRSQREKGDYNEDLLFALQYVRYVKYIVYTGYADYWYDTRENSLSRSAKAKQRYFEKYEEKYRLWKAFIDEQGMPDQAVDLATSMLYHFLISLDVHDIKAFRDIVCCSSMQEIIQIADTSNENPRVIRYIQKKAVRRLWLLY